jgi:alpha-D-ribose 1-methylphosphonate 5-triphosphate synthase subunit PhnH
MSLDVPGFADPVLGAQSSFRAVLAAMSRPGTLHAAGETLTPPAPLDPATSAVLLTLIDAETPLHAAQGTEPAQDWIAFHTGAPFADRQAPFVLALDMPPLATLNPGTDDAPEDSATLILQVASLGEGTPYRLAGPGLAHPAVLLVEGLPPDFVARWNANHALYPRGIDLILCAGSTLTALPRSLRITEA